jgi:dipeptidyl aminopeptidase/acylaminoacyl peptidase
VTDIYGLMYKPSNFDPTKKYPVVNYIYPGPQIGSAGDYGWSVGTRGNARALAELGFIVTQIDHLGTVMRSKAFHDQYYGDMADHGLPDHVVALRQLAAARPYMDLNRVGIYGHSGGGFASTAAMFQYPDFFHVAVSTAGNHDNRTYGIHWGEKYQGLLERDTVNGTRQLRQPGQRHTREEPARQAAPHAR